MIGSNRAVLCCLAILAGSLSGCASVPGGGRLVEPNGEGPFPAVIVLHSRGGLSNHEYDYAFHLSRNGYYAITANYFAPGGTDNIQLAYDFLLSNPRVDPHAIGIVGFSRGAYEAINFTFHSHKFTDRRLKVIVSFYIGPIIPMRPDRDHPAILFLHGERDRKVPPRSIASYCKRIVEDDVACEYQIYQGVGHAFDRLITNRCDDCDAYNGKATADSRTRALEFLDRHL